MSKTIRLFIIAVSLVGAFPAYSFNSPISFGIAPPVQFPPSDVSVTGLRVSGIMGRHRDMYGIDLALGGNVTDQRFVGIALSGLYNITHGETTAIGLQAAGLTNINTTKTNVYGIQIAGLLNNNVGESAVNGLQIALVNLAGHTVIRGAQIGLFNKAKSVYGLQIGVVNICDNLHGLQIGLANFHHKGLFAVSPILNVGW
jgi:hypothetical protein